MQKLPWKNEQYGKCCAEVDALRQLFQAFPDTEVADLEQVQPYAFYGRTGEAKAPCEGCARWMAEFKITEMHP